MLVERVGTERGERETEETEKNGPEDFVKKERVKESERVKG